MLLLFSETTFQYSEVHLMRSPFISVFMSHKRKPAPFSDSRPLLNTSKGSVFINKWVVSLLTHISHRANFFLHISNLLIQNVINRPLCFRTGKKDKPSVVFQFLEPSGNVGHIILKMLQRAPGMLGMKARADPPNVLPLNIFLTRDSQDL